MAHPPQPPWAPLPSLAPIWDFSLWPVPLTQPTHLFVACLPHQNISSWGAGPTCRGHCRPPPPALCQARGGYSTYVLGNQMNTSYSVDGRPAGAGRTRQCLPRACGDTEGASLTLGTEKQPGGEQGRGARHPGECRGGGWPQSLGAPAARPFRPGLPAAHDFAISHPLLLPMELMVSLISATC